MGQFQDWATYLLEVLHRPSTFIILFLSWVIWTPHHLFNLRWDTSWCSTLEDGEFQFTFYFSKWSLVRHQPKTIQSTVYIYLPVFKSFPDNTEDYICLPVFKTFPVDDFLLIASYQLILKYLMPRTINTINTESTTGIILGKSQTESSFQLCSLEVSSVLIANNITSKESLATTNPFQTGFIIIFYWRHPTRYTTRYTTLFTQDLSRQD